MWMNRVMVEMMNVAVDFHRFYIFNTAAEVLQVALRFSEFLKTIAKCRNWKKKFCRSSASAFSDVSAVLSLII